MKLRRKLPKLKKLLRLLKHLSLPLLRPQLPSQALRLQRVLLAPGLRPECP